MPMTLMCATQIRSEDTRTYVSVGELRTPTMPTCEIGIIISVTNLVLEPSTQDRDTVPSFLESNVLPLGYRKYQYISIYTSIFLSSNRYIHMSGGHSVPLPGVRLLPHPDLHPQHAHLCPVMGRLLVCVCV